MSGGTTQKQDTRPQLSSVVFAIVPLFLTSRAFGKKHDPPRKKHSPFSLCCCFLLLLTSTFSLVLLLRPGGMHCIPLRTLILWVPKSKHTPRMQTRPPPYLPVLAGPTPAHLPSTCPPSPPSPLPPSLPPSSLYVRCGTSCASCDFSVVSKRRQPLAGATASDAWCGKSQPVQ